MTAATDTMVTARPGFSWARLSRILRSPLTVVAFIIGGVLCGIYFPAFSKALAPIGSTYLNLLKMVVLPFIVSSVIFSMRSMVRDPQSASYLVKVAGAVAVVSFLAVAIAGSLTLAIKPGEINDQQSRIELGRVLNSQGPVATDLQMPLAPPTESQAKPSPFANILDLVPSNVFNALSSGDTIKVLLFCLLFGLAVGHVPHTVSSSLADALDTVYRACIILTHWFNVLLPFASFAMIADQTASIGVEPLRLMIDFLVVLGLATLVFLALSIAVIAARSRTSLWTTLKAHQPVLMMAIATRSSVACLPWIIDLLAEKLKFNRVVVELLVPLQTALLRAGPIMLYVCGTIFIAQLYGRPLGFGEFALVGVASVLIGLTTAGMSGIVVLSQMAILCGYLGLPFEAAFALFLAVDSLSDTLRTLTIVATVTAATAAIAPCDEGLGVERHHATAGES
jgi:Na+/H+-dicarboxylate symporter